jgi:hypothetical protein
MKMRNDKNSHIGSGTHTSDRTNVKVQTYFMCEITLHVAQILSTIKTAATTT